MGPILVIATINLGIAVLTEATLSFLGVGLPPTEPSLGTLIRIGNDYLFSGLWWITVFPSLTLVILVLSVNLLGDWMRDAFNPEAADGVNGRTRKMPLLEVQHLRIEFPTRRGVLVPVDDISFVVERGEILGVVGESGAGKSLTGMAIVGLLEPPGRIAGGRILFEGDRIDDLSTERYRRLRGARIGMIFQDPLTSLNPLYTVGRHLVETILTHENINAGAARRRALDLLAEVGFPSPDTRFDQFPHQFSGGMRQRIVIALALCTNPKLVVADEPTTALDVSIQAQIIALLKRLCREHHTAVMLINP